MVSFPSFVQIPILYEAHEAYYNVTGLSLLPRWLLYPGIYPIAWFAVMTALLAADAVALAAAFVTILFDVLCHMPVFPSGAFFRLYFLMSIIASFMNIW